MASGPAWTWTHFPIPVQPAVLGILQQIAFVEATTLRGDAAVGQGTTGSWWGLAKAGGLMCGSETAVEPMQGSLLGRMQKAMLCGV